MRLRSHGHRLVLSTGSLDLLHDVAFRLLDLTKVRETMGALDRTAVRLGLTICLFSRHLAVLGVHKRLLLYAVVVIWLAIARALRPAT
ncbi:MAG: hypothetical protein QNJ22_06330 [Desulfosarcinaceae bacterium]|nr:hypothetical protein [Desulfosarcinaceae bacterium]